MAEDEYYSTFSTLAALLYTLFALLNPSTFLPPLFPSPNSVFSFSHSFTSSPPFPSPLILAIIHHVVNDMKAL